MLKRTVSEFREDNLTDWAAALTYYAILSIFPALIVLVSILGLAGDSATNAVLDNINELGPGPAQDIISGAIREIASSQGIAGLAFVIGLVAALWSASGYVGAFSRASNVIYETEEGRPFWKLRPLQVGMTLVLLLLVAVSAIAIVVSGPLASDVGKIFGVEGIAVTIFNIVKWPVIVLIVMTMLAILYYGAPNVRHPGLLDHARRHPRRPAVDPGLRRLRGLRGQLRLLQRDLWQPGRGYRLPHLAMDLNVAVSSARR